MKLIQLIPLIENQSHHTACNHGGGVLENRHGDPVAGRRAWRAARRTFPRSGGAYIHIGGAAAHRLGNFSINFVFLPGAKPPEGVGVYDDLDGLTGRTGVISAFGVGVIVIEYLWAALRPSLICNGLTGRPCGRHSIVSGVCA